MNMLQTQTVDIDHVIKVLQSCPNYDKIVNYEFPYGDILSEKLIDWYREMVFSANGKDENQLRIINAIDKSMYLYVSDNKYKKGLKKILSPEEVTLKDKELIRTVLMKLINYTNQYEKNQVLEIDTSKWI